MSTRTRKPAVKCLVSKCQKTASSRGLCISCYNTAMAMIKKGEATEAQFISKGLMLEKKPKGFSLLKEEFVGNIFKNHFRS